MTSLGTPSTFVALFLAALVVSGCGAETAPDEGSETSDASAASDAPAGFCDSVTEALEHLDLLTTTDDLATVVADLEAAHAAFSTVDPPAGIAAEWTGVEDTFKLLADGFAGVDATDPDALAAAEDELGDEAFGRVFMAAGARDTIAVFAQTECDLELGADPAAVTDACELLEPSDLVRIFGAADPEAQNQNYGEGFLECTWEGGESEVAVALMPSSELAAAIGQTEPLDTAADLSGLDGAAVYPRFLGIGRFTTGHTVTFTRGDQAILVAVRTGEDGSQPVDVGAAAQLALLVNDRL